MSKRSLLKEFDVIKFSDVQLPANTCDFRNLYPIELYRFRKCLGLEFYEYLQSKVADYSTVEPFTKQTYAIGEKAIYKGAVYIAIVENDVEPTTRTKWKLAPKFTEEEIEELWCDYLAPYLAWEVLKYKARGIEDFPIDNATIGANIGMTFSNLEYWLKDENDHNHFDKFVGNIESKGCGENGKSCLPKISRRNGGYRFA